MSDWLGPRLIPRRRLHNRLDSPTELGSCPHWIVHGGLATLVSMGRKARIAVGTLLTFLFLGGSAAASNPPSGVHLDPNSPGGKQYSLPVASVRSEGSSGSKHSSSHTQLFGTGVTPTTSTHTSAPPTTTSSVSTTPSAPPVHRAHRHVRHAARVHTKAPKAVAPAPKTATAPAEPAPPTVQALVAATANHSAGDNSWVALLLGGTFVLVVGGLGGFALVRRSTGRKPLAPIWARHR